MGKVLRVYTNRPFMSNMPLVNKSLQLLASGMSKRDVAVQLHTDLMHFRLNFHFPNFKVTTEFVQKVCTDVVKHKLGYAQIVKKYGNKGLEAVFTANKLDLANEVSTIRYALNKYRFNSKTPKTIQEITDILNTSRAKVDAQIRAMQKTGSINTLRFFSKQRADKIIALHNSGITTAEDIARFAGCTESLVYKVLRKNGTPIVRIAKKYPKELMELIARLREKDMSWNEIAEITKKSTSAVRSAYSAYKGKIYDEEAVHNVAKKS